MCKNDNYVQGSLFPAEEVVAQPTPQKKSSSPKKQQIIDELKKEILRLRDENSEKQNEIVRLQKECASLTSKAEAFDELINSNSLFPIGIIAKNFGRSAQWLNQYLHKKGVQFIRGEVWELYAKYANKGYTRICWYNYSVDSQGRPLQRPHTYWTAKGLVFIRELLKADGLIQN